MKIRTGIWFASLAGVIALVCVSARAAETADIGQIDDLVKQLEDHARKWAMHKLTPAEEDKMTDKLNSLVYDMTSVGPLTRQLKKAARTAEGLYLVNRLIEPLLVSETNVIKKVLPVVKQVAGQWRYHQFPEAIKKGQKPPRAMPGLRGRIAPDAMIGVLARSQQNVQAKISAEKLLQNQNLVIRDLAMATYQLMVQVGDPAEDAALMRELQRLEQEGMWAFKCVLEVIEDNADALDSKRTMAFVESLASLAERVRLKGKTTYKDPCNVNLNVTVKSMQTNVETYSVMTLLQSMNNLGRKIGKPAVKIPTASEIEEEIKKAPARGKRKPGRGDNSRRLRRGRSRRRR
ncbi:MAG: hypothetical protein J7M14_08480 [Planctomycetes bacterium]|nr:hypothetical protein [Planctomycetota bacterium]